MTACIVPGFKKSGICSPPYCRHCPMPEAKLYEAAALLDQIADQTVEFPGVVSDEGNELFVKWITECRAMARKCRGET